MDKNGNKSLTSGAYNLVREFTPTRKKVKFVIHDICEVLVTKIKAEKEYKEFRFGECMVVREDSCEGSFRGELMEVG